MAIPVFVTGGTGFIGANLVRLLLQEGFHVRALVRRSSDLTNLKGLKVEIVQGDINDPDLWPTMQGCTHLFHVAAHYSLWLADRDLLFRQNVEGTRNVLAAARRAGISRTVYTSSVAAIGTGAQGEAVDESHQSSFDCLMGDYKKSKYLAEQEAFAAVSKGQDVVIVNPTTPVGAWDIKPTPTGSVIVRFLRGDMPFYVDTALNFVSVEDVAWGHILALQKGHTGRRYILGCQNLSLKSFLEILSQLSGIPAPKHAVPYWLPLCTAWVDERILSSLLRKTPSVPLDGVRMSRQAMLYNCSRAVTELGLPQTPVTAALDAAIQWFISHGHVRH